MPCQRLTLLVAALCGALLAGCGGGGDDGAGRPQPATTVVATTTQLADLARQVAGDRARVEQILRPNSDPHGYEPRPSDVRAVAEGAVVLRSGGDVDVWLGGVLRNAGSDAKVLTLLDALTRGGAGAGAADPHWWQDPRKAIAAVGLIRDALAAADPGGRATYARRAARYLGELGVMDRRIAACFDAVAPGRRKLVTDHDALGQFADRYGLEVIATVIPARSTQAQASAGEIARLVRTIRTAGVRTIFPESSVNPKLAGAVAREAGAAVGPPLYADTLGPAGSPGETYAGAMRFNARAIAAGLDPSAPRCQL